MKKMNLKFICLTGILGALAGVLMSLEFPLPFMPPFYKVDFSDVPTIIGLFTLGPSSAILIEVIKIVLKLLLKGTTTAFVGELANLFGAILFVYPIYFIHKKTNNAKLALTLSLPIRITLACLVNAFITLPMYAASMGISMDDVIAFVQVSCPHIKNLATFLILGTIPFNFIKIGLNNIIGYFIFERISKTSLVTKFQGANK